MFELLTKAGTPVALAAAVALLGIFLNKFIELYNAGFSRRKDKLELLGQLFDGELSRKHPFIIEQTFRLYLGYNLSRDEILFLMGQTNPSNQVRRYAEGFEFLEIQNAVARFNAKWDDERKRKKFILKCNILYFIFALLAAYLMIYGYNFFMNISLQLELLFVIVVCLLGGTAVVSLLRKSRMEIAIEFINRLSERTR